MFRVVLNAVGVTFLVAAALALMAGISTLYWPTVPGTLESVAQERVHSVQLPGHVRPRQYRWRAPASMTTAVFRYQVAGTSHEGSWICLCLPIGVVVSDEPGSRVNIRYFPLSPSISVLRAGPDGYLIAGLTLVGLVLLLIGPAWRGLLRAARARGDPWQHR